MLKILSQEINSKLTNTIFKGTFEKAKAILEENDIDVNSFTDDKDYDTIIMKTLRAYSYGEEESKRNLID